MKDTKKLVIAALLLALALILPFLCGQIPQIGNMLLPMHLPVLLCGFICGPVWGCLIGGLAPLLRSVIFGMPPMLPTALCMAFELAAYGLFSALFYQKLGCYGIGGSILSLLAAQLLGRVVWGVCSYGVYHFLMGKSFTLAIFFLEGFMSAWPGILLQLLVIPPLLSLLGKLGVISPLAKEAGRRA